MVKFFVKECHSDKCRRNDRIRTLSFFNPHYNNQDRQDSLMNTQAWEKVVREEDGRMSANRIHLHSLAHGPVRPCSGPAIAEPATSPLSGPDFIVASPSLTPFFCPPLPILRTLVITLRPPT